MGEREKKYINRPATANAIVVHRGKILLIQRQRKPFKDHWAIPGGFVEITETTQDGCLRELKEEAGVSGRIVSLVGVYDTPDRDPRHTVCISYLVEVAGRVSIKAGDDARKVDWFSLDELPEQIAFDHREQIQAAKQLYNKKI